RLDAAHELRHRTTDLVNLDLRDWFIVCDGRQVCDGAERANSVGQMAHSHTVVVHQLGCPIHSTAR
ncbi:hypothetical protein PENTCL1PPCAC_21990, partial [Pristionchus entomophagus]